MKYKNLCDEYHMPKNAQGTSATNLIKHIYYEWTQQDFQNFMNQILENETIQGEAFFDDNN